MEKRVAIMTAVALALGALLTLALFMTNREAQATTRRLYVDRDAPDIVHNGLAWATAFTEVQTALGVSLAGDEIWVAEGVYYADYNFNVSRYTGYVTATVRLKDGVAVYGGFAGTETALQQRDWRNHVTVLSGDLDRNDRTDPNGVVTTTQHLTGTNAWSVVSAYGAVNAVLDGFTVTGGNANGSVGDWWDPSRSGGGVYVNGVPALRNLVISGNAAGGDGGGLFAALSSAPTISNVIFVGNSANTGGGMSTWSSRALLTNVAFRANFASAGGAMYNVSQSRPTLINVTFFSNTASSGGAIANASGSSPTLTNCILWGNAGAQISNGAGNTPTISYSDVQGSGGSGAGWDAALGADGGGNIDADPLFMDAAGGNLWLWIGSPAVDAGNNTAVPAGIVTDLAGSPRLADSPVVSDTGSGAPPIVDMGAYEAQPLLAAYTRLEICTDAQWYEPSTGQPAEIQSVGPVTGSIHDVPAAAPIWGQDAGPTSSATLTRVFTIPLDATSITGVVTFVADDGVTLTLNSGAIGNYDALVWPPPAVRLLDNLRPGANEFRAAVYNRGGFAWVEACAVVVCAQQWRVYAPVVLRGY